MPTFIPQPGEIHDVDLRDLADHPLLASIPTWPRDSAEFGGLVESIRDHGLDYELLVDTAFQIVDGRNRRNAVAVLGGVRGSRPGTVRCRFVAATDTASIIVASLANRRHLGKGAIAYLCAPMFEGVLAESKARRIENLRRNGELKGDAVPSETALSAGSAKTAAELAAKMGLGGRIFEQALQLRRMFEKAGEEARAKYEPRLLGPWQDEAGEWNEPVGLGYMINGLTSLLEGKASSAAALGARNEHDRLFDTYLGKLRGQWEVADPEQRRAIGEKLRAQLVVWPADLLGLVQETARAAAREQAKAAVGT